MTRIFLFGLFYFSSLSVSHAQEIPPFDPRHLSLDWEAEDHDDAVNLQTLSAASSSAGQYVRIPSSRPSATTALYRFETPQSSREYYLWIRAQVATTSQNRIVYRIDDRTPVTVELAPVTSWRWTKIATTRLNWARHRLLVIGKDPNVKIDRFILTADPRYVPVFLTTQ